MNELNGIEIAGWLAMILGKGTVLLMLGFGFAAVIGKRQSATGQRILWSVVMAGLVLLAGLDAITPKWLSLRSSEAISPGLEPEIELPSFVASSPPEVASKPPGLAESPAPAGFDSTLSGRRPDPVESDSPAPSSVAPAIAFDFSRLTDYVSLRTGMVWLLGVWLAGAILLAGRFALSRLALRKLERRARKPGASWPLLADHISGRLGLSRTPRLLMSPKATVPMAWGIFRPRILLPESADELDASSRRYLLQHEISHIAHRDSLSLLIAQLAVILHWPNPLVWLAMRRLRLAQEQACDNAAMENGGTPADYAELLIDIARRGRETIWSPASVALTMANGSSLNQRISAILDPDMKRKPPKKIETTLTLTILSVLTLCLAGLAWAGDKEDPFGSPSPNSNGFEDVTKKTLAEPPETDGVPLLKDVPELGRLFANEKAKPVSPSTPAKDPYANMLPVPVKPIKSPALGQGTTGVTNLGTPILVPVEKRPDRRKSLEEKLNGILIADVEFVDTPLDDVLEFLKSASFDRADGSSEPIETGGIDVILLREARSQILGPKREAERYSRRIGTQEGRVAKACHAFQEHQANLEAETARETSRVGDEHQERLLIARAEFENAKEKWTALKSEDAVALGAIAFQENKESGLAKACEVYHETVKTVEEVEFKSGGISRSEALKSIAEARERLETAADRYLDRIREDLEVAERNFEKTDGVIRELKAKKAAAVATTVAGLECEQARQTFQNELQLLQELKREGETFEDAKDSSQPEITLALREIPLGEVLKYVAQLAGLAYEVQTHAVVLGTPEEIEAMRRGQTSGGASTGLGGGGDGFDYDGGDFDTGPRNR